MKKKVGLIQFHMMKISVIGNNKVLCVMYFFKKQDFATHRLGNKASIAVGMLAYGLIGLIPALQ